MQRGRNRRSRFRLTLRTWGIITTADGVLTLLSYAFTLPLFWYPLHRGMAGFIAFGVFAFFLAILIGLVGGVYIGFVDLVG